MKYFSYFFQKTGFDISCKLSTICMKCQNLFSENLIVLGFNDTSTLVGHFVSSPRDREKRDRRDSRRDEREDREERGPGVKVKKQKK